MPLCSASFVLRPMARPGASIATCGSFAVRPISASIETAMPGAIATPKYSPAAEIAMNTVAVPKLIDDQRRAETRSSADRRRDEIRADFGGIFGRDAHESLRLRLQKDRCDAEEALAGRLEHRVELRHDARDRDRVDRARLKIARLRRAA